MASELRPIAAGVAGAPRVYVDANVPAGIVASMRQRLGWDVLFVLEDAGLRRAPDAAHFAQAAELGRTLITLDRDFLDSSRFPPAPAGPGVVVCVAPDERALLRLLGRLDRLMRACPSDAQPFRGRTLELGPDSTWLDG